MKKTIIVTALCAVTVAGVGLVSHAPASASATSGAVTVRHCQVLRTLPSYGGTYQGADVYEPSGAARYRELVADGVAGGNLQAACRAQVTHQRQQGGASGPTLAVLRELGY